MHRHIKSGSGEVVSEGIQAVLNNEFPNFLEILHFTHRQDMSLTCLRGVIEGRS